MTVAPTDTVDQLILDRLTNSTALPPAAADLIYAAMLGFEELANALGGSVPARREPPHDAGEGLDDAEERVGTYLSGVEVTGFRGIGPTARLELTPAPGLTIVTGRNGSGKSSFAEAVELALTGDNRRWSGRSQVWKQGWRNLHTSDDPKITVKLGVENHRKEATVERRWPAGADLDDAWSTFQLHGRPLHSLAEAGWQQSLELYRPFLSYAELGGLLSGRPSDMHDSLQNILGLERLTELEKMLKDARRAAGEQRKAGAALLPALRESLAAHPDPRAREATAALSDVSALAEIAFTDDEADDEVALPLRQLDALELPDPDELRRHIDSLRAALDLIESFADTQAEQARAVAHLLQQALVLYQAHPGDMCPICEGRSLDDGWAVQARAKLHQLSEQAKALEGAHDRVRAGWAAVHSFVPSLPDADVAGMEQARAVRKRWSEAVEQRRLDDLMAAYGELTTALVSAQGKARELIAQRRRAWRPVVEQIRAYLQAEQTSRQAAANHKMLQKAIDWLTKEGAQIRNDKLAPITQQAGEIWTALRQESNVELHGITLAGTGPQRRVDLDAKVDGAACPALGVMSQGELHSLALALFLPRATLPASPFRFLVIDDPVQSMDPLKVYGLAQVLDRVARNRQVVVFSHDDRLPAAVRHLGLSARILTVDRLAGSKVSVIEDEDGYPAFRYLKDARAIANDTDIDDSVRIPVACNLIRNALEFTCQEIVRIRGFNAGRPVTETEKTLAETEGLRKHLILALGITDNEQAYRKALEHIDHAAHRLARDANKGAHGNIGAVHNLHGLISDARRVVEKLRKR